MTVDLVSRKSARHNKKRMSVVTEDEEDQGIQIKASVEAPPKGAADADSGESAGGGSDPPNYDSLEKKDEEEE